MKYLSIVFVAAITLVSCGGGMETACDCINAASELDMEDSAAVAAFDEAHGEACEALVMDTAADFSECAEAAAELGLGGEEAAAEEAVEVVEEAAEVVEEVAEEVEEMEEVVEAMEEVVDAMEAMEAAAEAIEEAAE